MTRPIENCPKYTAEQVEAMAADLRDAPGTSMLGTHISVSTGKAVAMYEVLTAYAATLRQQAERGDGAASDDKLMDAVQESLLEYRLRNWADESGDSLSLLDHLSAGETIQSGREEIEQMADAVCEAVAPLLRAPAEQGGRVDGAMSLDLALGYAKAACTGPMSSQAIAIIESALAQNAQGEAVEWQSRFNSIQGGWSPWRNISKAEYESMLSNTAVQMGSTQLRALYLHAERARAPATDADIAAWAERHDLTFGGSKIAARDAFEDAESLHLAAAPSQPESNS